MAAREQICRFEWGNESRSVVKRLRDLSERVEWTTHGRVAFEAFWSPRGVPYRDTGTDPGVSYPPLKKHAWQRKVGERLMS